MSFDETMLVVICLDLVVTVLGWFKDRREHREHMASMRSIHREINDGL